MILWIAAMLLWAEGFLLLPRLRSLCLRSCDIGEGMASPLSATFDVQRPSLAIIIPARNEEQNLPILLRSLPSAIGAELPSPLFSNPQPSTLNPQLSTSLELLVVDDASTDRTAALAKELGATVVASKPLPEGWRGKTWACHQGALAAKGKLLLFLDADTSFEPGGLARMLASYRGGALSLCPYHAVRKPYEELSLFFNLNMVAGTAREALFGQMLLVDAESYRRAGGHEAVRGRILENLQLSKQFRACGVPVNSAVGRGVLSFRMYPGGLRELINGWTKAFASGAGQVPRRILLLIVAWKIGLMLVPIGWLVTCEWPWAAAYALCAAQVGWFSRKIGSFRGALLYPVPLIFFFLLFAWSAARSGKQVSWKGREIRAD